jgi:catechol 2,3-dioxygenase-like lactoylglutathione lyase family enzyme
MAKRALTFLTAVTWCVENLDTAESAWRDWLGFRTVERGQLTAELCAAWDTPAATGQSYCLMEPASGDPVFIRFIETGERPPPGSFGWCAAEFLVQDPDALAERLANSPFRRLGGPADLFPQPKAPRAMQMIGPSGEVVYFTRILPGGSRFGLKGAKSEVDRIFIVPVGGPSITTLQGFYCDVLGLKQTEPMAFINPIMAHVCGVMPNTVFPTAIVPIPGRRFLIELDQLPASTSPRQRRPRHLPAGMSMVTFLTANLDTIDPAFRAPPIQLASAPYDGRRTTVITGPAGEWLELVEHPG